MRLLFVKFIKLYVLLFYINTISCSVSSITLDVVRPADIDIPNHIQNVVIVNRSLPSKSNYAENIIDGILSGEGIGDDKKASSMCVLGLQNMLKKSLIQESRFNVISADGLIHGEFLKGTGTNEFPSPIKWKKINKISKNYDIDGLIVLETFDSNSSIINGGLVSSYKRINKKKVKVQLVKAVLDIQVQAGWRIYDVKNQKIIDEKIFNDYKSFSSNGINFNQAKNKLPNKRSAISETGLFAGEQYAFRISPKNERVTRKFYKKANKKSKKANEDFKKAFHFIKQDNIQASSLIWLNYINHQDPKISGRACFNMALASELKNKYILAIDWIKKSISHNTKNAVDYYSILKNRQVEIKKVTEQLKK